MDKIKFGTDGWRAIIAQEYTVQNVARVAFATAVWLKQKNANPLVVIGHDCRFGGRLFTDTAIKVLCSLGIKVISCERFVSTPMISFGVLTHHADQGVVITASHNPPSYNGFKLKGAHGGPTPPEQITEVENLIPDSEVEISGDLQDYQAQGLLSYVNLDSEYEAYIRTKFDIEAMNQSPFKMAYDAMYGAGQDVVRNLFPKAVLLHCEINPSFKGIAPEPLHKNLLELSATIKNTPELKFGLANDGDADRIALYDEDGKYVDSHHIILLLIHYLHKYKNLSGKVAIAASTTLRVNKLCEKYGLPCEVTPIGFKYISQIMMHEDVLVGGEESGGISVKGHIPERDGIYDGLVIYEFMNATGKTLKELCKEIYDIVGEFYYERADLHLTEELKQHAMTLCKNGITAFGKYQVIDTNLIDGYKYELPNNCWTMIRASGTEPLLRIYAEGNSYDEVMDILKSVRSSLGV
ncbi:MAG: phosphoglucomutase/phosphomannomutase family protein [Bacteroidetes bacterium]|nr:phosphoglucomutase/phosphomannomutase family protein [Bacteroidota bacterium]